MSSPADPTGGTDPRPRRRFHLDEYPWLAGLLVCHLVFAAVLGLFWVGALQPLDLLAYDAGLRARTDTAARDDRIVAIGFDESDIQRYGYPLSDQVLADLLAKLVDGGAAAVGVDIYRDLPVPPGTEALNQLVAESPNITWVYLLGSGDRLAVRAQPTAFEQGQVGFADLPLDPDDTLRRALLFAATEAMDGYSLSFGVVAAYLAQHGHDIVEAESLPGAMQIGDAVFAPLEPRDGAYAGVDTGGYQMLLDFAIGRQPFTTYTVADVLDGKVPAEAFADRIVFVGAMAASVKDDFVTPLSTDIEPERRMYGVLGHAQVASQILRAGLDGAKLPHFAEDRLELFWLWLCAVIGGVVAYYVRALPLFLPALIGGFGLQVGLWFWALLHLLWLPVAPGAIAFVASAALFSAYLANAERIKRRLLARMFNSHVSERVAKELWRNRDVFQDHGRPVPQRLTATVMFTDINGFTPVSERLTAEELMDWLNDYMGRMADLVMERRGIIDKFIGDAVMAVFGVPVPHDSRAEIAADAQAGLDCAFAMERELRQMNRELTKRGLPEIRISIGLYTGELVAGSLGSTARMEYTVIGDTVNTAARLEAYASKEVKTPPGWDSPCRIVIGAATWDLLEGKYQGVEVGEIKLKGKDTLIKAYLMTGRGEAEETRAAAE